jgi:uncharacterized damage-inducible protein DinB
MADDPMVAAARYVLMRQQLPLLRQCVAEAPSEALNWRPGGADTNSIAVLATHTMHSARSWMSVALGAPLPDRDRDSEFRVTVEATSELLALVDALTADIAGLLDGAKGGLDWAAMRKTHPRNGAPQSIPAGRALLHAIEHVSAHVGHMQLTRQWWETRPPLSER